MNLGGDVVFQIFLRLPVGLLLRFRCVCKEWCDLIDSGVFKECYLARRRAMDLDDDQIVGLKTTLVSSHNIPYEEMKLILNDGGFKRRMLQDDVNRCIYTISFTCWYDDCHSLALSALLPSSSSSSSCTEFEISGNHSPGFMIINHVDGIICFINGPNWFDISLVNPAIREFRKLPIPLFDLGGHRRVVEGIGLGYDDFSDDYNVVAIVIVHEDDSPRKHIGIVYSLSTNSWKILGDMSEFVSPFKDTGCLAYLPFKESVFSHGSIHWCMEWNVDVSDPHLYGILAFDVTNESFREIPFPRDWRRFSPYADDAMFPHLFLLDKSTIALLASTNEIWDVQEIEVWVMKEYGDSDSWMKLYSITSPPRYRRPLSFWKKDKLLLLTLDMRLICYDIPRGELDDEPQQCYRIGISGIRFLQLVVGHESFVSIKPRIVV